MDFTIRIQNKFPDEVQRGNNIKCTVIYDPEADDAVLVTFGEIYEGANDEWIKLDTLPDYIRAIVETVIVPKIHESISDGKN